MPFTCAKDLILVLLSDSNIQFQMLESPQGNEMQETLKERSPSNDNISKNLSTYMMHEKNPSGCCSPYLYNKYSLFKKYWP